MNHLANFEAGSVGTAIAFTALNLASKLSLYDLNGAKAKAEVLDLRHGLQFLRPATIEGRDDLAILGDAYVVVITAGPNSGPANPASISPPATPTSSGSSCPRSLVSPSKPPSHRH